MTTLFIVRHGQASFGSENYDRLSDLGRQQSRWLGEYFVERGVSFRRVLSGNLARQRDTAIEILAGMQLAADAAGIHPGLDEYDGRALYAAYTGDGDPHLHQRADRKDYWRTFRAAYQSWVDDQLSEIAETWSAFKQRIQEGLAHACTEAGRDDAVLVVTSGGVIGCALSEILGTPGRTAIELNFQTRNTAFSEVVVSERGMRLVSFNSIPHLERPERRAAITHM